jgi:murein L,D-transpeptidase YcbB/YkuD
MVRLGFLAFVGCAAIAGVAAAAVTPNWPVSITFVGAPAPSPAPEPFLQPAGYVVPEPTAAVDDTVPADRAVAAPRYEPQLAGNQIAASTSLAANESPVPAPDPSIEPAATAAERAPAVTPPEATAAAPAEGPAATEPETAATSDTTESPAPPESAAASEPAAAPAAEATVAAETPPARPTPIATEKDISIRLQLRLMNAERVTGPIAKEDRASVAQFYKLRGYKPAWIVDGRLTDSARALGQRLMLAETDGLNRADFPIPPLYLGEVSAADAGALADADLMLSESIATYVRQAQIGRVDPASISSDIDYRRVPPDPVAALNYLLIAKDPVAAMVAYNPPHEGFARLRAALAEARAAAMVREHSEIAPGPTLKPGMTDARVGHLRQRLEVPAAPGTDPNTFDDELVQAVMAFQKANGLKPDGMVGGNTLKRLNDAVSDPTNVIISNMERWRWLPRDLGRFYVNVNVPQFEVIVHRSGAIVHSTRIVVGKPANRTPIFSDEIEHVIVNPYWNVPSSITTKEMWPDIVSDPSSLTRQNFEVFANVGGRFREVDPLLVDWYSVNPRHIQIRQRPGAGNALGNIKFMFPNKYDVYLHDTPSKSLFQRDYRAFSHGCMRVMNPMEFADALLTEEPDLSVARIKKLIGGRETRLDLTRHVPVHITYFTAWVDEEGKLQLRNDIYGHDAKVRKALGL